jgi:hypothetical protein
MIDIEVSLCSVVSGDKNLLATMNLGEIAIFQGTHKKAP